ncbi:WLM domain-containing protein [Cunninghamella echinulata]|nr:WLM domain-containing protein [Cunninghamella echinulata]
MSEINFKVSFKGKVYSLNNWSLNSTVGELKEWLSKETAITTECQKLLWKGKMLQDNSATLSSIGLSPEAKLMMMGTSYDQIKTIQQLDQKITIQKQVQSTLNKKKVKPYKKNMTQQDIKYTFHQISVLPEFDQQDKARGILQRLVDDRGIKGIMAHYKWSVGQLIELSPFERTILGYNRNNGQLIALRLRTDDLSGFRSYDSIRKVLLHELTHNVWSDHDDNFHKLNRQLNKDVVNLDWSARDGHQLSTGVSYYQPIEDEDEESENPAITWEAGAFRLGGSQSTQGIEADRELRRDIMAKAALSRLTKEEEREMDEGCGS